MDDHYQNATDIDQETLRAIMAVQLEDIESLASRAKGKQREGTATDAQVALQIYIEDLHACDTNLANRDAAERIFNAVTREIPEILESWRRDDQIARDHKLARRMASVSRKPVGASSSKTARKVRFVEGSGQASTSVPSLKPADRAPKPSVSPTSAVSIVRAAEETVASVKRNERPSLSIVPPRISSSIASHASPTQVKNATQRHREAVSPFQSSSSAACTVCVACNEEKQLVVEAPCQHKHRYCRECIVKLFELASRDESLFPPKCDGKEIPLDSVRPFLSLEPLRSYESRAKEVNASDRTYCHNGWCRAFIPNDAVTAGRAKCQKCGAKTCITCKGSAHAGDCPKDVAMQQLQLIAQKQQWQRCYSCRRFVQLDIGCHHIKCVCGAEFCYVCGMKWKTCGCDFWDERRLITRRHRSSPDAAEQSDQHVTTVPSSSSGGIENEAWLSRMWKSINGNADQEQPLRSTELHGEVVTGDQTGVDSGKQCCVM